jgi:hypothetical protein
MIRSFQYLDQVDIPAMKVLTDSMMEVLESIDEGLVPNRDDYTPGDLANYVDSLVSRQRSSLGQTKPGSWCVAPDDSDMDSDTRVEFIFRPTYIAVATLSRVLCEYPLIALATPRYDRALRTGMLFCSYRGLRGHGYEADEGAIDALRVLSLGKVPWLLNRHPEACPELKRAIDDVAEDMARRLLNGTAVGAWGEDYSDGFRSAVETLRLKNDPEFIAALEETRRHPYALSKENLPW